jgi:uncharacterized protein (TIGR03086 family)
LTVQANVENLETDVDPIMVFQESGEFFLSRLALVPEEAWGNATPCPDWTVRDVAVHVINGFRLVPTLLAQEPVDPADRNRDTLGANLTEAGSVALEAAVAALRRPGALDAEVNAPAGVMPARTFAMVRMADTVIHTWDMSSGAGIDTTIPAQLVEAVTMSSPPAFLEGARQAGVFGPLIEVDPGADKQTVLLALYGRRDSGR